MTGTKVKFPEGESSFDLPDDMPAVQVTIEPPIAGRLTPWPEDRMVFISNSALGAPYGRPEDQVNPQAYIYSYVFREQMPNADWPGIEMRALAHYCQEDTEMTKSAPLDPLSLGVLSLAAASAALVRDEFHMMKKQPTTPASAYTEIPDRLSVDDRSEFYRPPEFTRGLKVKFEGKVRPDDVIEYCISEGWVRIAKRMANGKFIRERGRLVGVKHPGVVEPFRV